MSNEFFKSRNIKVFPCASRGYYKNENDTESLFNPEACTTSEYSFTTPYHKISSRKESYVVSWTPMISDSSDSDYILKCVINGYYFEISNCKIVDFFDGDSPLTLYIKVVDPENNLDKDILPGLTSFNDEDSLLDILFTSSNEYYFTGLKKSSSAPAGYTASLTPFTYKYTEVDTSDFTSTSSYVGKYVLNSESKYILVTDGNKDKQAITVTEENKTNCYTREEILNPAHYTITDLLDYGTGRYSLRVLEDIEDGTDNSTTASGDYSVALGKNTTASGLVSTALGNNTEAGGDYSIATGNQTKTTGIGSFAGGTTSEANANNSFAFGTSVKTNAANQVVFGKNNTEDTVQAFIIANDGNKFTVSYNGDIKALGTAIIEGATNINNNLTVKGNITADKEDTNGTAANNFVLGSTEEGSSGTITVYGSTANTKVFEVTNTGKTYIADDTDYSSTTADNTTTYDAALQVKGGVKIDKKLNVGDTLDVATTANIGSTLTTKGSITANGNGNNILTLGSDISSGSSGAIDIYDINTNKVFSVTNSGKTEIKDSTTSTSVETGALVVTGGVGINDNLNVANNLSVFGNLAIGPTTGEGVDKIHGLSIQKSDDGKHSIKLNRPTEITDSSENALTVQGKATINNDLKITGSTNISGTLTATGDISFANSNFKFITNPTTDEETGITPPNFYVKGNTKIEGTFETKSTTISGNVEIKRTSYNDYINGNLIVDNSIFAPIYYIGNQDSYDLVIEGAMINTPQSGSVSINGVKINTKQEITDVNTLEASGLIQALTFNATSDIRKKTNIKDYKCEKSILELPIKSFEYINDESHTNYIGCIAQDLQEICPEIVTTDKEGYLSIQESKLVYLLLQEVKELKEKVEILERR